MLVSLYSKCMIFRPRKSYRPKYAAMGTPDLSIVVNNIEFVKK